MQQEVKVENFKTNSIHCQKCKGKHLKNGVPDQQSALKNFGIIPNNCVPDCHGKSRCPAASN